MNYTKATVHVWGKRKKKKEMLSVADVRGCLPRPPPPPLLCAIRLPCAIRCPQGLGAAAAREGPWGSAGAQPCAAPQHCPWLPALQNGGSSRVGSAQVLPGAENQIYPS